MMQQLTFGTRGSALARRQTESAALALQSVFPTLKIKTIIFSTKGDKELTKPLPEIGGKGLFTAELETALREKRIDLAVHSLKDLPVDNASGLTIGAILPRENPADVLISRSGLALDDLPPNAVIGTGSLRRAAQLLQYRSDLKIASLRGNIDTRLQKALDPAGPYDAVILAAAGLNRMSLTDNITQQLPVDLMLPAPGQGAVAVQCRADDASTLMMLANLDHLPTRWAVTAERAFLAELGGGCSVPVGALATFAGSGMTLRGMVADPRGKKMIREEIFCPATDTKSAEPEQIGQQLARQMLALGAAELLEGFHG